MAVKATSWSNRTLTDNGVPLNGKRSTMQSISDSVTVARAAMQIGDILEPVRPELALVEEKMKTVDGSLFTPLADAFVDLIGSGGKRLRPAVALLTSHLDDSRTTAMAQVASQNGASSADERVIALAASVEMLHTSTLVHDDVIDGALLRRGAPTLNAQWSRGATVLAGDYMFARAAYFAAETGDPRVIQIFSDTLEIIVNGELRQLWSRRKFYQNVAEYYRRIEAKTASLFSAAAEAAGVLAGLSEDGIRHARSYGYNLGVAFQIVDDILDFTGDESSLGKPAGSDLLQGTLTLPFFHYVQSLPDAVPLLDQLESAHATSDEDPDAWRTIATQVAADVKHSSAIDASRADALVFLQQAQQDLSHFPHSPHRTSLLNLCDFVVQRTY